MIAASGFLGYGIVDAWQERRSRGQLPPRPGRGGREREGGQPASTGHDPAPPDSARLELVEVVHRSLEPAHVSVWIRPG